MTEDEADKLLILEPANITGLIAKGDARLAAGDERAATSFFQAALRAAGPPPWTSGLDEEILRISALVARAGGNFRQHLETVLAAKKLDPQVVGPRFADALAILFGEKQVQLDLQQPSAFYFPGLPQKRYYERDEFPWVEGLEAAANEIREELAAVLAGDHAFRPYVQAERDRPHHDFFGLLDNPRWGAFYLIENGVTHTANAARCPRTMAALKAIPLCDMPGRTPSVHFSLLRPGTRIPPHTGMLNTRLIGHLPLVIPENCGLRVGGEMRQWEQCLIFDDSIVHEAWNDSAEARAILLFDIWRPELTALERSAIATMFHAIDTYRAF